MALSSMEARVHPTRLAKTLRDYVTADARGMANYNEVLRRAAKRSGVTKERAALIMQAVWTEIINQVMQAGQVVVPGIGCIHVTPVLNGRKALSVRYIRVATSEALAMYMAKNGRDVDLSIQRASQFKVLNGAGDWGLAATAFIASLNDVANFTTPPTVAIGDSDGKRKRKRK